jgi:hypothetical protein
MSPHQAEAIVKEYGRFQAERMPMIYDVTRLPGQKELIESAFLSEEQNTCDIANSLVKSGDTKGLAEIDAYLQSIRVCKVVLRMFTTIDSEDSARVNYFNQYPSLREIPKSEWAEFDKLHTKYFSRGHAQ